MNANLFATTLLIALGLPGRPASGALREENFDQEPANWEGVNNRSTHFEPRTVSQDFGYSPTSTHAGGAPGEIGGRIYPAGEPAYYGSPLPRPLTFDSPMSAEGSIFVAPGPGHFLLGFFSTNSLNEWRTPNTLVARINSRGAHSHFHLEYGTSRWRAGAGVIGEIVPGERILAKEIPNGHVHHWKLAYDPSRADGNGLLTFSLNDLVASIEIPPDHRAEGVTVSHFGLLSLIKTWDSPGEVWLDNIKINESRWNFSNDPKWDEFQNRRTYVTNDTRPKFNFGWSPTHHANGKRAGEMGGLIFRGDCREPARLASYGDRIATFSLDGALEARGKLSMRRGVTDSTAAIGFFNSVHSTQSNPSQKHSIPMDFLGINIEGPSSEGFFFYPVYRTHGDETGVPRVTQAPRIFPDGRSLDWFLKYDPAGAGGQGSISVGLDSETITLALSPGHKAIGATFDRFGICTPWIDGNSVTVYFDDLKYTAAP
ncbi:MAG: hypothetical protein ACKV19_08920 [Verrucomicrobiales bacterium]